MGMRACPAAIPKVDAATPLAPVMTLFPTVLLNPFWSILPVARSPRTFPISYAIDRPSKAAASAPPARVPPTPAPTSEAIFVVSPFWATDWVIPVLTITCPVCDALWAASFPVIPAPLLTSSRPTSPLMIVRPICDALWAASFSATRGATLLPISRCPTSLLTISKPLSTWSQDDLPVIHHMAKCSQLLVTRLYSSSPILLCALRRTRSRSKLPCSIRYTVTFWNRIVFSNTLNLIPFLLYSIVLISPLIALICFTIAWCQ